MSAEPVHHFAPSTRPGSQGAQPQVDRTLHIPRTGTVVTPTEPEAAVVPFTRPPQNQAELEALLGRRAQEAERAVVIARSAADAAAAPVAPPALSLMDTSAPLAVLGQAQEARRLSEAPPASVPAPKPFLPPENETEARSRLAEAIRIRDEAHRMLAQVQNAVVKAKSVEVDAEARAAAGITTEMRGADDLARRILEWSISGGERPDLAPDAASLDARREQDLARIHVDAARQAVRALEVDLNARRSVAEQAERAVTQAASEVVAIMIEDIAVKGTEAQRIYESARMASRVVFDLGATGGVARTIRAQPVMRQLGRGGELGASFHETAESGPRHQHHTAWSGLLKALQNNPDAALG